MINIRGFFIRPTRRGVLFLASALSVAMLLTALVAQYGFYLHPCELCMAQRYPYIVISLVSLLAAYAVKSPHILYYTIVFCALLFVVDGGIATYHAGVEIGLFPAPTACANTMQGGETLEELRRQIMDAPLVTCDQAMVHILGLSLAAWNALAAFSWALLMVVLSRRLPK